ncbi:hypothetical protein FNYG_14845 [Fusarium nygamai]|uniref:Nephrocystin 3-like N-terminal domain-containing protein n=1 Tax=Gibberella nygamai TaxID=42673 RepID=A0A2K0UPK4_GIBNY|nr:hypothetical protein FNYG_14845 [Fusarium nygamai]
MDPLSAIGLASGIITFIDFSWGLVTGTMEIYKSRTGATFENVHIGKVIEDLRDVSEGLEADLRDNPTRHEKALQKLAEQCSDLSEQLLKLLQSLGGRKKKKALWASVWVKWDSMRKAGDVKEIEGRLIEYRSQILLRMNLMLTDQQSGIQKSLAALQTEATNWKAQTMAELKKTKSRLDLALRGLKQQEEEINDNESSSESDENEARARGKSRQRPAFQPLQALLDQFGNLTISASAQHCILRQLIFDSMRSREAAIHTPETGTFEWMVIDDQSDIFNSDQEHEPSGLEHEPENSVLTLVTKSGVSETSLASSETSAMANRVPEIPLDLPTYISVENQFEDEWQDLHNMSNEEYEWNVRKCQKKSQIRARAGFSSWLSCCRGGNLFHISGKAGSGKSTLMKFLYNHKRTRARLEEWASPCKLVLAHFYFWVASGDDLQRSLEGLYRSILFQVLSNNPDLIPSIFPLQWDLVKGAPFQSSKLVAFSFPPTAFQEAFNRLLTAVQESHRICLFIDGMDEYDDKDLTYWKLAQLVEVWTSYPHIKICSSARPYLAFTETFGKGRQIMHLHHTTMYDIYVFSLATFEKDPNKAYIRKVYPHLARSIVARAEGVFLWAWLVVRILVEGAGQQDSLQILVKKLFSLPKDMGKLYSTLLERVANFEDKRRLSLMLRLNLLIPVTDLVYYGWLDDWDNPEFPPNIDLSGALEGTKLEDHCHRAWKQVTGISNGLLQIVENPRYKEGGPGLMDAFSVAPRTGTPPWAIISPWAVTFAHRTVRDFLIENPKLISDQHANSESDMLQIWYRLLLCDYAHTTSQQLASLGGSELTNRHNDRIKGILGRQKVLVSAPILDKFDFHSRLISARAIPFIGRLESQARWDTAVLNYAARCGYHDFIISKLKAEPSRLSGTQAVSNLLVCMALGYAKCANRMPNGCSHVDQFLALGYSPFDTLEMITYNGYVDVPAWFACAVSHIKDKLNSLGTRCSYYLGEYQIPGISCFKPFLSQVSRECLEYLYVFLQETEPEVHLPPGRGKTLYFINMVDLLRQVDILVTDTERIETLRNQPHSDRARCSGDVGYLPLTPERFALYQYLNEWDAASGPPPGAIQFHLEMLFSAHYTFDLGGVL